MISIFPRQRLYQKWLYFSRNERLTASVCDPDHADLGTNAALGARYISHSDMDGNYWIDAPTLGGATHVYTDSNGANTLQSIYNSVYTSWVGDDSGVVVEIKNLQIYGNSWLDIVNQKTWGEVAIGSYASQIITAIQYSGDTKAITLGIAHHSIPDFTTLTSTNNEISSSPYKLGRMQQGNGNLTIDMGAIGNVKPWVMANLIMVSNLSGQQGTPYVYNHLNNTFTTSQQGTIDVRTGFTSPYGPVLYNIQLDRIANTRAAGPVGAVASSDWYIQYETPSSVNNFGYNAGNQESFSYPLHGYQSAHIGVDGCPGYHHWFMHTSINAMYCQTSVSQMNTRITLQSSTPAASGGDDNGNPLYGWYRETGSATLYTYWNGYKWLEEL